MNSVGIDVSKGKSTVCVMSPGGEVIFAPFEVLHTVSELADLAKQLLSLTGETKVIMECTGNYHLPIAHTLCENGFFVSCVNPMLIRNFGNNSIRKSKNDNKDSVKIANYGLLNWQELLRFTPTEESRAELKKVSRQYAKFQKIRTELKNNLISLLDETFPGINALFTSCSREADGHEKWIDFVLKFWHRDLVSKISFKDFSDKYRKWCSKNGYYYADSKAKEIHDFARTLTAVMPKNEVIRTLIQTTASQITTVDEGSASLAKEMDKVAQTMPEYEIVRDFYGVGKKLAPQIIAEIGDVRRFAKKSSLVAFAGLEPQENQSGKYRGNEPISKKGSPYLRKALFQVMLCILQNSPEDDKIYQFLDKKRSEQKHYFSYMNACAAKFLRIYYARVTEYFEMLEL